MIHFNTKGTGINQIVFIHGNSQSTVGWNEVINCFKDSDFKLMAIDLPGHGKSFRSDESEKDYSLKGMSKHVLNFFQEIENEPYIVVVNSLGSNIMGEIVSDLKNCKGIFLTGSSAPGKGMLLPEIFLPNPNTGTCFVETPTAQEVNLLITDVIYKNDKEIQDIIFEEFFNTDPKIRLGLANSIATSEYSDELKNLEDSNIPLAFVFGADEKLCNIEPLKNLPLKKWKNEIILIEECGHFCHFDQPVKLADIIKEFAKDCFN